MEGAQSSEGLSDASLSGKHTWMFDFKKREWTLLMALACVHPAVIITDQTQAPSSQLRPRLGGDTGVVWGGGEAGTLSS